MARKKKIETPVEDENVLTEEDALKAAEAEGITFVDKYVIVAVGTTEKLEGAVVYDTREEAEVAAADLAPAVSVELTVMQVRSRAV